jgi:hypothetical protein
MNVEAEEHARQVRLRAERRAGELLRESRNIHPADRSSPATDLPPKLSDLGITKKESWHHQKGIVGLANDWPQSPRAILKPLSGTVRPQSLEGSRESRNGVGPRHPMPANKSGRVIRCATIAF